MFNRLFESLKKGILIVRNNGQLTYTLVVAIVIFVAFVFTSNQFVTIAQEAQDRLINVRVGSIQDAFVPLVKRNLDNPEVLNDALSEIIEDNRTIQEFRVIRFVDGTPVIASSLFRQEIGSVEEKALGMIDFALIHNDTSLTFPVDVGNGREFVTVRAVVDDSGENIGVIVTRQSLSLADQRISESIQNSIIILVVVMVIVLLLFFRHARIIDYSDLYRKLKSIDQLKDDFISMASHELRTPLTVIRGYAEFLTNSQNLDEKDMKNVHAIETASEQLSSLVSDMLDVSRIEQGRMKFEFEQLNPNTIGQDVVDSLRMQAENKGLALSFTPSDEVFIRADKNRLRQVLINLLGNSIKYTQEGSVSMRLVRDTKEVEIRISDTGIGISAEDQQNLFSKFYRVKSKETQAIVGTGLGLWITKQIIEQMGGSIGVESIKGKGSDFIVRLPIVKK